MAPKRKSDGDDGAPTKKVKTPKAPLPDVNSGWKSIKPSMLCLGEDLAPSKKVAALDLDQTLIEAKVGSAPFSTEPDSWEWWSSGVKDKLKEWQADGYKLAIFSNQNMIKSALGGKAATNFKAKIDSILKAAGVEAVVHAATQKDENRKPELGMWKHFVEECNGGVDVDLEKSFFVGDAAGRPVDIGDSDKEFAKAIGLPFKTPEEVFGDSARPNKYMAAALRKLAAEVMESGENNAIFRRNAFIKAAGSLEGHDEKITSGKEAGKLPGIGKGCVGLIDEFIETGTMGEREKKAREDKAKEEEKGGEGEGGAAKEGADKPAKAGQAFLDV